MDAATRVSALRERLAADDIAALLVTTPVNIRYLTGFTGSTASLVVTEDRLGFVTDGRYNVQAAEELGAAGIEADIRIVSGAATGEIADLTTGCERVGVEASRMSWSAASSLEDALEAELVPTSGVVEDLRAVKDAEELEVMAAAVAVADAALAEVLSQSWVGRSEEELAVALEWSMRSRGASGVSFPSIVAAGPRGALPHARPSAAEISAGAPVVIDYGCLLEGYCSDTTRTVSWGEPHPDLVAIRDAVAAAQDAARAVAGPGVACTDVDAAARAVLDEAGWGECFVHGTGHGIGLEVHEPLRLSPTAQGTLEVGNVVTIEPGVYIEGLGGIRIEDIVVITDAGCDTLTSAPKTFVL